MNSAARLALTGLALTLAVACGGPDPQPADKAAAKEAKAAAKADAEAHGRSTNETVFDPMIKTEDRARAVEGVVMDANKRTEAAAEEQSGRK